MLRRSTLPFTLTTTLLALSGCLAPSSETSATGESAIGADGATNLMTSTTPLALGAGPDALYVSDGVKVTAFAKKDPVPRRFLEAPKDSNMDLRSIVVDDDRIWFRDFDMRKGSGGSNGAIYSAKTNGDTALERVAAAPAWLGANALTADSDNVYWSGVGQAVTRRAKKDGATVVVDVVSSALRALGKSDNKFPAGNGRQERCQVSGLGANAGALYATVECRGDDPTYWNATYSELVRYDFEAGKAVRLDSIAGTFARAIADADGVTFVLWDRVGSPAGEDGTPKPAIQVRRIHKDGTGLRVLLDGIEGLSAIDQAGDTLYFATDRYGEDTAVWQVPVSGAKSASKFTSIRRSPKATWAEVTSLRAVGDRLYVQVREVIASQSDSYHVLSIPTR